MTRCADHHKTNVLTLPHETMSTFFRCSDDDKWDDIKTTQKSQIVVCVVEARQSKGVLGTQHLSRQISLCGTFKVSPTCQCILGHARIQQRYLELERLESYRHDKHVSKCRILQLGSVSMECSELCGYGWNIRRCDFS